MTFRTLLLTAMTLLPACATGPAPQPRFVHLGANDPAHSFEDLASAFADRNPGYGLQYAPTLEALSADTATRVVFVQGGESAVEVFSGSTAVAASDATVGDVILVRSGQRLAATRPIGALVFTIPEPPNDDVPTFVRPDWDPRITDTPGGCATETGAYRRIALTWMRKNGPYTYHAINAHRVRITDSFTHYHPTEGGFDEFYLVQMAQPGARLITSSATRRIVQPGSIARDEVGELLQITELHPGDLVYLPRGVIHRGLGGVLAHVITVPGFVPGSEIGVDHHLAAINARLGLDGDAALPLHADGAKRAIVK